MKRDACSTRLDSAQLAYGRSGQGHVPPHPMPEPAPAAPWPVYGPFGVPSSLSDEVRQMCNRSWSAGHEAGERKAYVGGWGWGFICGVVWCAVAAVVCTYAARLLGWS